MEALTDSPFHEFLRLIRRIDRNASLQTLSSTRIK
jgi:hypothetical protein